MAVNKVEMADGEVLIDLTNDTVTENDVLEGVSFHSADGETKTGAVVSAPLIDNFVTNQSGVGAADAHTVYQLNSNLGTLQFKFDEETQQPQWRKVGADSWNFFKRNAGISYGDIYNVVLNDTINTTAKICYIDDDKIYLLGNESVAKLTGNAGTQVANYRWNAKITINGIEYLVSCKAPTLDEISNYCLGTRRSFSYLLQDTVGTGNYWMRVIPFYSGVQVTYGATTGTFQIIPFIKVNL